MKVKMSMAGIGPKLGGVILPYLILTILLTVLFREGSHFPFLPGPVAFWAGIFLLAIGLIFYFATVIVFLREFRKGELITKGTYSLCRNPIYASIIVFFLPAAALIANSWFLLTAAIFAYIIFILFIGEEESVLKANFGEEYLSYRGNVNRLFPFPHCKRTAKAQADE